MVIKSILIVLFIFVGFLGGCDNNGKNNDGKLNNNNILLESNILPMMILQKHMIGFVDADTITYDFNDSGKIEDPDEKIRLMGYDAPENGSPRCLNLIGDQEPYATIALNGIKNIVLNADLVTLRLLDQTDKYGRRLGHIYVDSVPLALIAVQKGWAYETISRYGYQGFVEEAEAIIKASENIRPEFEHPRVWRQKHKKDPSSGEG